MAIFTILYDNYYPPHGEFKLICIEKFSRRTWVNFTQQYGKNRQRCQKNIFYYAVWPLLLYFYREFSSKILSLQRSVRKSHKCERDRNKMVWSSFLGNGVTERNKKSTVAKVARLRVPLCFSLFVPSSRSPEKLFKSCSRWGSDGNWLLPT